MTLGMCIRKATSSLPFQPTSPTCFAADGPMTCCIRAAHRGGGTRMSTTRTAPGATTGGCHRRPCARGRIDDHRAVTDGPTLTCTPGPSNDPRTFARSTSTVGLVSRSNPRNATSAATDELRSILAEPSTYSRSCFLVFVLLAKETAATTAGGDEHRSTLRAAATAGRAAAKASKEYYRWSNGSSHAVSH